MTRMEDSDARGVGQRYWVGCDAADDDDDDNDACDVVAAAVAAPSAHVVATDQSSVVSVADFY